MTITPDQAIGIALAHYHSGRHAEADALCRRILAAQPDHAEAAHRLGMIALAAGRHAEALEWIVRAAALAPARDDVQCNLGVMFRLLGRIDEAVAAYRRALAVNPNYADAWLNLGEALGGLGRVEDAIGCFERAIALRPDDATAHNNLGNVLRDVGRVDEAIASNRRAIELHPDFAEAHTNLGIALTRAGHFDEAVASGRRAIALRPDFPDAHANLAKSLMELDRWDEAIACCERALAQRPDLDIALVNLGVAWKHKGDFPRAIEQGRRLVERHPGLATGRWNLAILLLLLGRFEEGWQEFEARLAIPRAQCRRFSAPRWDGGSAPGQTILIHAEQGYGDALHFLRYLPLVRERSGAQRVLLDCPARLARLIESSGVEVVPRENLQSPVPPFDLHLPMLSLPLTLGEFEPLAVDAPYLRADPALRAAWRERLGPRAAFRVGVTWAGNPRHGSDRRRSIAFEKLAPLLRVQGVQFFSLQIGAQADGMIDLTTHLADFADTAALMCELDLVITVDTAAAHLAGALGHPVWTLLAHVPDWRWQLGRDDTPWYPTMRLFRQRTEGGWDDVIARVTAELERTKS